MPKYRLSAHVTVSAYTTVDAETLEAAVKIAAGRPVQFGGGPYDQDEHWLIEEADGSPTDIVPDED